MKPCKCPVDSRIVGSKKQELNGRVTDLLTYECPVCKKRWTREIKREEE